MTVKRACRDLKLKGDEYEMVLYKKDKFWIATPFKAWIYFFCGLDFSPILADHWFFRMDWMIMDSSSTMTEAIALATEVDLNNYGYLLLNQKNFDKAIEVLELNTQRHPKSANAWDSLGEAYALKGDKKNAIPNFKKSLALKPNDGTKANSEKYLKQLGAM